jgi:hypothetical protein
MSARRPQLAALSGPDELAVRNALVVALVESRWTCGSWADAEQAAVNLIDDLAGAGYHVLKADWS